MGNNWLCVYILITTAAIQWKYEHLCITWLVFRCFAVCIYCIFVIEKISDFLWKVLVAISSTFHSSKNGKLGMFGDIAYNNCVLCRTNSVVPLNPYELRKHAYANNIILTLLMSTSQPNTINYIVHWCYVLYVTDPMHVTSLSGSVNIDDSKTVEKANNCKVFMNLKTRSKYLCFIYCIYSSG